MEEMNNRNLGRINVSAEMVRNNTQGVAKVFAFMQFVPLDVDCKFQYDSFEYLGISHLFPQVPEGGIVPEYMVTVRMEGDELIHVGVEEITHPKREYIALNEIIEAIGERQPDDGL